MTKNATNLKKDAKDEIELIKNDLSELKETLTALTKVVTLESKDKIQSTAKNNIYALEQTAKQVGKKAYTLFNNGQQKVEDTKEVCEKKVKQNPFLALSLAFLGGIALTSIIKK